MSAGPEGGRFAADPYTPPPVGQATTTTPAEPILRPTITGALAVLSGGQLRATIGAADSPARLLRRVTVSSTTPAPAYLYVGQVGSPWLVSGTTSGQLDEADYAQPVFLPEGQPLIIVWATGSGSAYARAELIELI